MEHFIIQEMNDFGYIAIMFFVVLENILPFIPSELVLTFAGFMTTKSDMTVPGVILYATLLSIVGSFVLYGVGRFISEEKLVRLVDTKIGRMLGFKKEDIYKSREWFNNKGKYSVLFCRCVPVLRCLISLPAGMAQMNPILFAVFTGVGSFFWNLLLVNLGAAAGASWETIVAKVGTVTSVIAAVLVIGFAGAILLFFKKRIRGAKGDHQE